MKCYRYKAVSIDGKYLKGSIYCKNESDLAMRIREKDFYLVEYKLFDKQIKHIFRNISLKDISIFSKYIASMLSAGFNISEALQILYDQTYNKILKTSIKELIEDVEKGNSFYDSIRKHENIYPNFLIEMINNI